MIGSIIRHEWRLLVRDKLLWTLLPVYALLIGYGVHNGVTWVGFQKATVTEAQALADSSLMSLRNQVRNINEGTSQTSSYMDPRNPGLVSRGLGFEYAAMSPSPMAPLAIGQSDLYPYYFRITRQGFAELASTDEIENPSNLATGRFDLGFVFTFLYPLLILALSYNFLSSEREQGTQSILLSQPVSLRQFVTGKILLRGMVILGTAVVLSLAGFLLGGASISSWDALWRLAMWIVVIAGYSAFWFGLAIVVNAFGKKSSTNALALMGIWLLFVILLPSMLNVLAKDLYPVPSRVQLVQALRTTQAKINKDNAQLVTKLLEENSAAPETPVDENESTTRSLNKFYRNILTVEKQSEGASAAVVAQFDHQIAAQQKLVRQLRFLSPPILTQMAMSELAGTGAARYQHFNDLVKRYHQAWRSFFDPKILSDQKLSLSDYDSLPRFRYVEEPLNVVVRRALRELVPLVLLGSLTVLLGFALLRRYPAVG